MQRFPRLVWLFEVMIALLLPSFSFAFDPACEPIVKATEARLNARTYAVLSETNLGGKDRKMELIKSDGKFYERTDGGSWKIAPPDADEEERQRFSQIRADKVKIADCKIIGNEKVGDIETIVMSSRLEMLGIPAVESRSNIGKLDGLPYLESAPGAKSSYRYKGVKAPDIDTE